MNKSDKSQGASRSARDAATTEETARDRDGFAIFAGGEEGAAHEMAHRLHDAGRYAEGRAWLGAWLEGRDGSGSLWTHLQWHMMVFELGTGDWEAARRRFEAEILPVAATSDDALTDAPAALWRLALAAPKGADAALPWEAVRQRAVAHLETRQKPFVALHHLLVLAGAADVASLDAWLASASRATRLEDYLLGRVALGLRAYAVGDRPHAAELLAAVMPRLHLLGGSHAQRELFREIQAACGQGAPPPSRRAA